MVLHETFFHHSHFYPFPLFIFILGFGSQSCVSFSPVFPLLWRLNIMMRENQTSHDVYIGFVLIYFCFSPFYILVLGFYIFVPFYLYPDMSLFVPSLLPIFTSMTHSFT